jgi:hypothetical protein
LTRPADNRTFRTAVQGGKPRLGSVQALDSEPRRIKAVRTYLSDSIHLTIVCASAWETLALAGIGVFPQTPELPLMTSATNFASAFF